MGYDGTLKFDTRVDESGFNSGISKLGNIAKSGLKVLGSAVVGVTAAMGAGIAVGVKYNASIEQYETSFEVMTGSASKAAEVIERLKEVGAETPFELNNLADVTQLLMNYGFTADDAMDKMMMLGDISQGSADKMQRIATAYGQMSSAGKVSLEDVKQMIEAGFNPLQEISESTGESMASLYDRISKGTISVDEITASMQRATSEGGKYFQSMEKQSQTMEGLISTLKDNAMQLLGDVVQPITESFRNDLLPAAIDIVEQLANAFKEGGTKGLLLAGEQIVGDLLTGVMDSLPGMIESGSQMLVGFLAGIGERLPELIPQALQMVVTLADALLDNLPTIINAGVSLLEGLITGIVNSLPTAGATGLQVVGEFINGILQKLPDAIASADTILNSFLEQIVANLPGFLDAGVELILSLVDGFVSNLPEIVSSATTLMVNLLKTILSKAPQLIESGIYLIGKLAAGLIKAVPDLIAKIPGLINDIKKEFTSIDWGKVGKDIIAGIAKGIISSLGVIKDAAIEAAGKALDSIKDFLGIHSPSTVFRDQIGKNMALGVGVGFDKNIPVEDMTGTLSNSVQKMQKKVSTVTQEVGANVTSRVGLYGSGNSKDSSDSAEINVHVTNVFEVDSEPLVEKTTKATIKKINDNQRNNNKVKGQ